MKAAPVFRVLAEEYDAVELILVHTGQHYDAEMSAVFFEELELPQPDVFLGVGSGTHGEQTAKALVGVERVLLKQRPALCVVAGDVNSTLAAALAASKLHIPVAHIESGLRSFDETMPEEANRRLTDHLSAVLLAHSDNAVVNLLNEGIDAARVHLIGNTMVDSLLRHLQTALAREPWSRFGVAPGQFGLVTLHRPALVDDIKLLRPTAKNLAGLARRMPIIFPVHPRTRERLAAAGIGADDLDVGGVHLCEPLSYLDFLGLEARAAFVLTDSGGLQEETSALGVPCFTLRNTTERPVTIELGTNTLLGADPARIGEILDLLESHARTRREIPYWDGDAGRRAASVLAEFIGAALAPA